MEISSPEFTEWQAFYQLEPFGDQVADQRHGVAVSTMVNLERNPDKVPDPFQPSDFIHWGERTAAAVEDEPVLLDDPIAQSNLIRAVMFGLPPRIPE